MPGEGLIVQALTPGGPAERNGQVRIGDLLQTIDGAKVAEMTDRDLAKSLLGQPGSKVLSLSAAGACASLHMGRCGPQIAHPANLPHSAGSAQSDIFATHRWSLECCARGSLMRTLSS